MTEFELKRNFLFSYLSAEREEQRLLDELEQVRTNLTRTTQALSDMPRGGQGSDLADGVQKLIKAESKVNAQISFALAEKEKVRTAINALPDPRQRLILSYRFINGKRLEKISCEIKYSIQHIKRLYSEGVNAVEIPTGGDTDR